MRVRRILPLLWLSVAAGCQQGAAPLSPADQQALRARSDSFVQRAVRKDFAGTAALFAPDGRFLPPNEPSVVGRDAILAWLNRYPPINAFTAVVDEVGGSGDVAYIRGHYAITVTPPGATRAVSDTGKYLTVNRRQPDGSWSIIADIFNSDKPPMR